MPNLNPLLLACALAGASLAAAPPPAAPVAPLLPGEALALTGPDGQTYRFGDSAREYPMGCLAELAWLKLEGSEWGSQDVLFKCTGSWAGHACWLPKGHGRIDLGQALQGNCSLAFLAWSQASVGRWLQDYGPGPARARLEEAFAPFLGDRMPPGEDLPALTPEWVGEGELLRTSADGMLQWLMDPAQDTTIRMARRLLLSFREFNIKQNVWWITSGAAPAGADPAHGSAWAVGGNGQVIAVLHLPVGQGKAEGLARFRAVLMVPAGK